MIEFHFLSMLGILAMTVSVGLMLGPLALGLWGLALVLPDVWS